MNNNSLWNARYALGGAALGLLLVAALAGFSAELFAGLGDWAVAGVLRAIKLTTFYAALGSVYVVKLIHILAPRGGRSNPTATDGLTPPEQLPR